MKKNEFIKSLLKLIVYANSLGVRVQFIPGSDDKYVPSKKLIVIDAHPDDMEEDLIISLLHEIGHVYDETKHTAKDDMLENLTYPRIYNNPTKQVIRWAVMFERRAWKYGKKIAKELEIPISKEYDAQQKICLLSYKQK